MAKLRQKAGKVLEGDFKGQNIYYWDSSRFLITSEEIKDGLFTSGTVSYSIEISKNTVDHYEVISAQQGGNLNGQKVTESAIKGGLLFGALGALAVSGMANSLANSMGTYDIAIYFKNGRKSFIRLNYIKDYSELKRMLFSF